MGTRVVGGDRPIGLAAAQRSAALRFVGGAPVLDTSTTSIDALIDQLERLTRD